MFMSHLGRSTFRQSLRLSSIVGVGFVLQQKPHLRNDSFAPNSEQAKAPKLATKQSTRRLANYRDLSIGSVSGLVVGSLIGKFSSLLVFLAISIYLGLQFLEHRNLIAIPWRDVFSFGNAGARFGKIVTNRSYFNISFSAAFLIAAFNI